MQNLTPVAIAALGLELIPAVLFGLAAERIAWAVTRWPVAVRVSLPAFFVAPYVMVSLSHSTCLVGDGSLLSRPACGDCLATHARRRCRSRAARRVAPDAFILLLLGLAWICVGPTAPGPPGLRTLNELLLVDAGLYGFLAIRNLSGTGFDFHLHWSDCKNWSAGIVFLRANCLVLGLALGYLHPHRNFPGVRQRPLAMGRIFFFTAVPEELFFRAWVQIC